MLNRTRAEPSHYNAAAASHLVGPHLSPLLTPYGVAAARARGQTIIQNVSSLEQQPSRNTFSRCLIKIEKVTGNHGKEQTSERTGGRRRSAVRVSKPASQLALFAHKKNVETASLLPLCFNDVLAVRPAGRRDRGRRQGDMKRGEGMEHGRMEGREARSSP